jgi:PPOX class probable F420-dependent enzyme
MTRLNLEASPVPVPLPDELLDLIGRPSLCFVATIMPDGSPQLTQTWVSTDGEHILINTPDHSQKARNVARDARVAVKVVDPDNTRRYFAVRGPRYRDHDRGGRAEHRRDFRQIPRPTVSELQRTSRDADDHDGRGRLRPRYGRTLVATPRQQHACQGEHQCLQLPGRKLQQVCDQRQQAHHSLGGHEGQDFGPVGPRATTASGPR